MRLIDADDLINNLVNACNDDQSKFLPVWIEKQIDAQPTINADTLLKEQEAKEPVHVHEEFQEHDWYHDEDGEIDDFAFEVDYHNGPMCKRCGYSFCIHCDPNGWNKKPCVIDHYKCPRCERYIIRGTKFCSNCGQEVKWNELSKPD